MAVPGSPGRKELRAPSPLLYGSLRLAAIWPIETVLTKVIWQRRHLCPEQGSHSVGRQTPHVAWVGSHALSQPRPHLLASFPFQGSRTELLVWTLGPATARLGGMEVGLALESSELWESQAILEETSRGRRWASLPINACRCMTDGFKKSNHRISLAVQRLRLHLPMQGVWVWSLSGG